jgi:hypothetical protein
MKVANQNVIQEAITRRFNVKVRIYKTIILPVVLYRCETWSLILREEHKLRVLENSVLRRISEQKRDEISGGGGGENCITRRFVICTIRQKIIIMIK